MTKFLLCIKQISGLLIKSLLSLPAHNFKSAERVTLRDAKVFCNIESSVEEFCQGPGYQTAN